jgi:hypothetical protein
MIQTLFEMAYNEHQKRKRYAESKGQIAWSSIRLT